MRRERHIVRPNRRHGTDGVAPGVLRADERGEEQSAGGEQVGEEAEGVARGVVERHAGGGVAAEVEQRLWVEGEGPAEGAAPGGFSSGDEVGGERDGGGGGTRSSRGDWEREVSKWGFWGVGEGGYREMVVARRMVEGEGMLG